MFWHELKLSLSLSLGVSQDALHVIAGVALQLFAAWATRGWLGSLWPWLLVILLAAGNEGWDLGFETWPNRDDQWRESAKDFVVTIFLPTLLFLASRARTALLSRPTASG